jgi:hypothetical protein
LDAFDSRWNMLSAGERSVHGDAVDARHESPPAPRLDAVGDAERVEARVRRFDLVA